MDLPALAYGERSLTLWCIHFTAHFDRSDGISLLASIHRDKTLSAFANSLRRDDLGCLILRRHACI